MAADQRPRIAPVRARDGDVADRLAKAPHGPDGAPLNVFATLAHQPRLMTRVNALGGCLMFQGVLGDRERELVVLRTAAHARCDYEIRAHRAIGAAAGLDDEELDAALDPASAHPWGVEDAALLRVADEVSVGADVADATWDALDGVLDDAGRIELLALVGFYRMLAGVLNGARVQPDTVVVAAGGRVG